MRRPPILRVYYSRDIAVRDISQAQRAVPTALQIKKVEIGGKRYAAISAHQLIESLSDADRARPGHVTG